MRLGADVDSLDRLAQVFADSASRLDDGQRLIARLVGSAAWHGPDAEVFRRDWAGHAGSLRGASSTLTDMASTLRRQASQQRSTSDAGSSGGGSGPAVGPGDTGGRETPGGAPIHLEDFPGTDYGPFGTDGTGAPELTDVNQGALGDCWFLTGLGAVARTDPDLIRDNITDNGDGTYTVTLHERRDGRLVPVEVTVDGTFPVYDSNGKPAYQDVSDGDETWAMLYEKAWAQHEGGYDEIVGGSAEDSLEAITGREFDRHDPRDMDDDDLVAALQGDFASAGMINLDTSDSWWNPFDGVDSEELARFESLDMQHSHQYVVERVFDQDGQMMVELYNPWGTRSQQPPPMTLDDFRFVSDELDLPAGSAD